MTPTGIHGGIGGYDPSLLQSPADRLSDEASAERDPAAIAADPGATRSAAHISASGQQATAANATESSPFLDRVTYGRRAPVSAATAVGVRLDVTG